MSHHYFPPPSSSYYSPPTYPAYTPPPPNHYLSTTTTTYSPAVTLSTTTTSPPISIDKLAGKIAEEVIKKPALVRRDTDDFNINYGHYSSAKTESANEILRRMEWEAKQEQLLKHTAALNVAARNREAEQRNRQEAELAELRARAAAEEIRERERERERRRRRERSRERRRGRSRERSRSRYSGSDSEESDVEPRRLLLLEERPVVRHYETTPVIAAPAPVCDRCGVVGHWGRDCGYNRAYLRVEGSHGGRRRSKSVGSTYSRSTTTSVYYT